MNELETKIDLAKACIDIGDSEATEVMEKRTEEQKIVAQTVIDQSRQ